MDKYQGLSISVCGLDQGGQQTIPGDYSLIHEDEQFYVMAVSAGSSGSRYFRSYQGARYAAEAAFNSLKVFASTVTGEALFADERTRERMIRQLEGSIIVGWGEKVRRHLAGNPFLPEEIDGVEDEKYKNGYRKGTDLEYAYRANIMAAVVTKEYCLVIRNGNGQCTVMEAGRQMEEPIPWNKKCTDSYSTSLCERSVLQDFRHYCAREVPPAVFLVTDGMCRCFEEPEEYHGYMEQLMQRALRNSSDAKEYLRVNLPELSRRGSHGDMCLAGVWHPAALREILISDGKREEEEGLWKEEEQRKQEEERRKREQEEAERLRREQEEEERRRREQEELSRIQREQEELERVRREQEALGRAVSEPISPEVVSEPAVKRRKRPPVLLLAAAAVAGAVFFLAGSGGSDKEETTAAVTEAEQSLEDKLETDSGNDEKESESIRQSLEESIKESLREEMEAQTTEESVEETAEEETMEETTEETGEEETEETTEEETTEEETTQPPATAPPATTAPPRTTAAPPPATAAPATTAPPPETAPPETAPPQTDPVPETPPAPPPTAPPETAADSGQSDIDAALQMMRPLQ